MSRQVQEQNISLPSVRELLNSGPMTIPYDRPRRHSETRLSNQTLEPSPLPPPRSDFPVPRTPKNLISSRQFYPSPASDGAQEEGEIPRSVASDFLSPLSVVREETSNKEPESGSPSPTIRETPTMVHYVPQGMPSVRSRRRASISETAKRRISKSDSPPTEFKVRMVKWDRTSDKGSAPLNVAPRSSGHRSCTLCCLRKKKCDRTDGERPNETHPCQACQRDNFVCQFISPSQLREGTTQAPTLESLKLYATQAERLRTIELEEKIVRLETALEMAKAEARMQQIYIDNSKVHQAVVSRYVVDLKTRLRELDPGCSLLECAIPLMPERNESLAGDTDEMDTDLPIAERFEDMPSLNRMEVEPST